MASKNSLSTVADGDNLPKNFSWVIPGVLAGCAAPKSAAELKSLEKNGISLLITLSSDSPPHNSIILLRKPRHETFACKNFEGIPVPVLLKITASIEKEILRKGKVAIHCMGGNGRTGTALGLSFFNQRLPNKLKMCSVLQKLLYFILKIIELLHLINPSFKNSSHPVDI